MTLNILCFDLVKSFIQKDMISALIEDGHQVKNIEYSPSDKYHDESFERIAKSEIKSNAYNAVLTANFHPELARICHEENVPYISWVYDTPPNLPTAEYMDLPSNKIFFFNKDDTDKYKELGLDTVYHLPLAVNTKRLDLVKPLNDIKQVSFIGKLYEPILPTLKTGMTDFQKGYIDGLIKVQEAICYEDIISSKITDKLTQDICLEYKSKGISLQLSKKELYWAISEYISCLDRINILNNMASLFDTHLYSPTLSKEISSNLSRVNIHPPVDYISEMPAIFKSTRINLCPIIRANLSGIPLRIIDILGCKSFTIASYQKGLAENFTQNEDIVMYTSIDEAIDLATYYINHENERVSIVEKGYQKVKTQFSYKDRIHILLECIS